MIRRALVPGLRVSVAAVAAAVLALVALRPLALRAATSELFFSEYIEGSSNNKALEIYNGTGAAIDLGAAGYNVQMFFNGAATSTLTIPLVGTVADGDVFVLAQSSANATILAQADQTNGSGWFNGDDVVVLRKGTTVIDVIGQIGFDPGTEWGAGNASTADNTIRRKSTICGGDINGADAFDPAGEWDGFATDTFDGLGAHAPSCGGGVSDTAPAVTSSIPASGAGDFPITANLSVTFSEPVTLTSGAFTLSCATSPSIPVTVSGGPTTFVIDPATDLPSGDSCTLTAVASQVADQDTNDPPDHLAADYVVHFTPFDACAAPFTPIFSIQGSGASAAITGNVTTGGVVVGDFEGADGLQGFYLQDPAGDGDAATSDGIFVFNLNNDSVSVGDNVRVTGFARERFDQTSITGALITQPATSIAHCGTAALPTPVDVTLPFETIDYPERFEGMRVRLPQTLVIAEYFNYERFGETVLALPLPGESRPFTPTAIVPPGAAAQARETVNLLSRLTLDHGLGIQNPATLRHPDGGVFALGHQFRGGDTVQDVVGVLGFDFDVYRIQPTGPATYTSTNPRPVEPGDVGGTLKVAAMNTLNFFITPDYPTGNPLDNKCGPGNDMECRGADFDQPLEFTRQRTKLLQALNGLDADVLGLNEIENSTGVEPLGDPVNGIVAGLNAIAGAGTYDYIDTGVIGTDAIRVGIVYKPARVTPQGAFAVLDTATDPRFIDTKNRPSLAQTFVESSTGAVFTVVVNHLKSKGSDCNDVGDPDTGDGQGNCNLTRKAAAQALTDWIASDPTHSGDTDVVVLGDFNSYAKEDPIAAVEAGADDKPGTVDDFTNLIAKYQGPFAYSYLFDAQFGYLDQVLGSRSLLGQVTGAEDWHINSDEPDILDYDTSFKPPAQEAIYEPNAYRTSDHDAVVLGLTPLHYNFTGFSGVVADSPATNRWLAGLLLPLRFGVTNATPPVRWPFWRLTPDNLFVDGYPRSHRIDCATGASLGDDKPAGNFLDGSLLYNQLLKSYVFTWKTQAAWRNSCRQLTVVLSDGSEHYVNFRF